MVSNSLLMIFLNSQIISPFVTFNINRRWFSIMSTWCVFHILLGHGKVHNLGFLFVNSHFDILFSSSTSFQEARSFQVFKITSY